MTELMLAVMILLLLAGFPMKMPLISAAVLGFPRLLPHHEHADPDPADDRRGQTRRADRGADVHPGRRHSSPGAIPPTG